MKRFATLHRGTRQRGFTLIELMVVVAILAIIAGIAVSAFSGANKDANRARGEADIAALNDAMARYYQAGYTYTGATTAALTVASGITLTDQYTFTIVVPAGGQTYSVRAAPASGKSMVGDGALQINNVGQRCYYKAVDAPDFSTCPKSF